MLREINIWSKGLNQNIWSKVWNQNIWSKGWNQNIWWKGWNQNISKTRIRLWIQFQLYLTRGFVWTSYMYICMHNANHNIFYVMFFQYGKTIFCLIKPCNFRPIHEAMASIVNRIYYTRFQFSTKLTIASEIIHEQQGRQRHTCQIIYLDVVMHLPLPFRPPQEFPVSVNDEPK